MASAELEKRKREEYEMQLFGFHSRTVYAILRKATEAHIKSKCLDLYNTISNKYKLNEEDNAILKKNINDLKKLYMKKAQPEFEKLQTIVEKYIRIPDNVLLEEDKCQAVQYSDEEYQNLNEKLENLQKTLKRVQVQSILLDKELEAMKGKEEFLNFSTKIIGDMEKASNFPKPDKNVVHFIETYQNLNKLFNDSTLKSLKEIYNPNIDHIQLKDCNSADDD
ncbi:protein MIS12 homolog [Leptopilina heterotoma]|uniref:protein MIS12 homolog n=1 Tax=Leptopilina heterotoma TaxID=63436 RepID=UPI001CA98E5E|nr:protein MIS12 homolog [Leptopilina heterotoma]